MAWKWWPLRRHKIVTARDREVPIGKDRLA